MRASSGRAARAPAVVYGPRMPDGSRPRPATAHRPAALPRHERAEAGR
jgi:hypothetical protein